MNRDVESGLVFSGAKVHEIKQILPVKQIIDKIIAEYVKAITWWGSRYLKFFPDKKREKSTIVLFSPGIRFITK
ncbi:hypothetical protein GCM10007216_30820 [Thalassobacillus devorans]|uniref:Uncharacterized protein n=1 Tax=Thalassobacillus devorans TaxID=279813 RepID=A0ABQ1PIQ4_9BACI|nr:hypothetical protein GCM10007216_30820 [Thalassobacillus devorans]